MRTKKARKSFRSALESVVMADNVALIAAEEFALSMVPLLLAVNEVGGIAAAIRILKDAAKKPKGDAG